MIKNLLYLSILTIFVVGTWVGFNVYHNYATSTVSMDTSIRIVPINPNFDKNTVNLIKDRKKIQVNLKEQQIIPTVEIKNNDASTSSPIIENKLENISSSSGQSENTNL